MSLRPSTFLDQLLTLAAEAGKEQCLSCLVRRPEDAGQIDTPPRDSGDLLDTPSGVAAVELLLAEVKQVHSADGPSPSVGVVRIRLAAYLASLQLPPAVSCEQDSYAYLEEHNEVLPGFESLEALEYLEPRLEAALRGLTLALASHDQGVWVDPNGVASYVVDVHDAALDLERWWQTVRPVP